MHRSLARETWTKGQRDDFNRKMRVEITLRLFAIGTTALKVSKA
jgi:hypothetical protein